MKQRKSDNRSSLHVFLECPAKYRHFFGKKHLFYLGNCFIPCEVNSTTPGFPYSQTLAFKTALFTRLEQ